MVWRHDSRWHVCVRRRVRARRTRVRAAASRVCSTTHPHRWQGAARCRCWCAASATAEAAVGGCLVLVSWCCVTALVCLQSCGKCTSAPPPADRHGQHHTPRHHQSTLRCAPDDRPRACLCQACALGAVGCRCCRCKRQHRALAAPAAAAPAAHSARSCMQQQQATASVWRALGQCPLRSACYSSSSDAAALSWRCPPGCLLQKRYGRGSRTCCWPHTPKLCRQGQANTPPLSPRPTRGRAGCQDCNFTPPRPKAGYAICWHNSACGSTARARWWSLITTGVRGARGFVGVVARRARQ
jgi:hypothetical protein